MTEAAPPGKHEPVTINGYTFAYDEQGTGETVILVHGSNGDFRTWQSQYAALAERYRTVTYSRRYHWPNLPIGNGVDYAMPEQLDDLRAFVGALSSEPVHLVGHSYGAYLCLLLSISDPGLVRSLVLGEAPVIPLVLALPPTARALVTLLARRPRTGTAIVRLVATGLGPATKAARRDDPETAIQRSGRAILGDRYFERLSPARYEQARANYIRAELTGSGFSPIDEDEVRSVQVPTLLVLGRDSPSVFHRLTDRLQELLPHAERVEIADASHNAHEDNAPAYNAAVRSFLGKHRESSEGDLRRGPHDEG